MITTFEEIFEQLRSKTKKRLVAAWAVDDHTIQAAYQAVQLGIVDATLVGDENMIKAVCEAENIDMSVFKIVHVAEEMKAISTAVDLINAGEGVLVVAEKLTVLLFRENVSNGIYTGSVKNVNVNEMVSYLIRRV